MCRAWSALLLNLCLGECVEQLKLSTPEVRWQWYLAHPSVAPELGRFSVALPGVAGSASVSVDTLQSVSQLPGQPVVSLPVPVGKKPIATGSKSSQQIVDTPVPKVVKKKHEVTHEVSSSSFSSHSAVPVLDPTSCPVLRALHAHCASARTWFARVGVRMEMIAVSLTLSMSCIRLQLNRSLTWPTVGSFQDFSG